MEFLRPVQQRVREINDDKLNDILSQGREKARRIAGATLKQAQSQIDALNAANLDSGNV